MLGFIGNWKDFWTGLIYIACGTAALIISGDYELGTARNMGPAYFPRILGALLIIIGLIALLRSFFKSGTPLGEFAVRGLILVVGATVLFGIIARGAGLIIALPVLIIVSAYASHQFRLPSTLALAAGLTLFCILVFLKGLGVPLPVLGTWLAR